MSKIMVFAFRPKRTKRLLGHFSLGQNFGNGWSKSIVLENKVVLHFDFNQVTRSGVMAFFSERAKFSQDSRFSFS